MKVISKFPLFKKFHFCIYLDWLKKKNLSAGRVVKSKETKKGQ